MRTINGPVTRANMNDLSKQRTDWRYHCSVTCYVTMDQWTTFMRTSHSLLRKWRHRATIVPARMRWNGNFSDASFERLYSVAIYEPKWRCWVGAAPDHDNFVSNRKFWINPRLRQMHTAFRDVSIVVNAFSAWGQFGWWHGEHAPRLLQTVGI